MPTDSEQIFAQALSLHQRGQTAGAERLYRQVLAASPHHLDALNLLGLVALQGGRSEEAIDLIAKAIALNDRVADFHNNIAEAYRRTNRLDAAVDHLARAAELEPTFLEARQNLANALRAQGKWDQAAVQYNRVLAIRPDFAEAHSGLGDALLQQGRFAESAAALEQALALKPDRADVHNNLGVALKEQGRLEEAAAAFERALSLKADFAEAHNNLGNAWRALDRLEPALAQFRRALALKPDFIEALRNLALALVERGQLAEALDAARRAVEITDGADDKQLFVVCAKNVRARADDGALRATLLRAWSELWGRPSDLAGLTISLIKRSAGTGAAIARAAQAWPQRPAAEELWGPAGLAAAAGDGLLRALLETALAGDLELERLLTATRCILLNAAAAETDVTDGVLAFCCALTRQCFINEYVFASTEDELEQARGLRDSLCHALESGARIPPLWPVAVAAYWPLHELAYADALLRRPWPAPLAGVLTQQITEPREELRCRGELARLTTIADDVSRQVQRQYEENPYPRWVEVARVVRPSTIGAWMHAKFPDVSPAPDAADGADVLIAGCGTGQQAIELAQTLPDARVLAVDLSLASLAYAQRKTRALGLGNIDYAQADILELGSIARRFDIIEATGVLHHLADPLAGWRVLLKLLRPRGLMHLGLYSETGRQHIVAARNFIAQRGYRPTAEDIRRCRQDLMTLDKATDRPNVTEQWDFFSTSACRDLLFHVQEHRMTLARIEAFLAAEGLALVAFAAEPPVAARYRERFPDDVAMTNLAHWHALEIDDARSFASMYLFWVRRRDN
ncbi:MAG TPA: tetratricopeptide repeat protein [Xanthobacteraceae bacterium]|nr:tetratricopeptide repeat protein [Xanthobacteraceae bacterium]